ncbi:DUF6004 family protein [Actinokineospora globicatena]|uniref:Uncharacterized protein n=1 Tax=Actinokineospora globicatena TaxID=103729 RepID=A0A9W6QHF3_9PSEU|nr:DUF6004 family protein [Actinokineospora globicatena]MCP2303644.1 hypothetical protein [Actinokineospora globicatena]GLW79219.1 hypothetical protein Aglo01_37010 [Actinokineospora globicatena]GLW86371.1 hypothetical protein Aglo02_40100 [Actinokineospora globicatena]GLW89805.1 hypothetical protein Aglo03_06210 [Actinokineospora globicatena]
MARETYESLNLAPKPIRPHILAAATIVYGDDYYNGKRETINLSGFVQMNKWPMPGFEHRVDERGRAVFDTELISAPEVGIKGFSYELNDRIQILSNPLLPNTGHVRQISPGKNFPAEFHIQRFGILETSTLRLVHRNVIDIYGVVDAIPPFKKPLTGGYLGVPRGDQPIELVQAPNVVRGTTLPEAWYPSTDDNESIGITPTVFFADSPAACMSMLVDPSMIIQTSTEATLTLEVGGRTVRVDLSGNHGLAAGLEILLFGPEKHDEGVGVLAQLARVALVGECPELGGRIMLRASWPKPSGGSLGEGTEDALSRVRFPAELHFDAEFDLVTPSEVLYSTNPVHLSGSLRDLDPQGTNLALSGQGAPLVTTGDVEKARITGLSLVMRESIVGEHAAVNV